MSDRRERECPECLPVRAHAFRLESQSRCGLDDAECGGSTPVGMGELSDARYREVEPIPCGDADEAGGAAVRAVALPHRRNGSAQRHSLSAYRRGSRVTSRVQPVVDIIEEEL